MTRMSSQPELKNLGFDWFLEKMLHSQSHWSIWPSIILLFPNKVQYKACTNIEYLSFNNKETQNQINDDQ